MWFAVAIEPFNIVINEVILMANKLLPRYLENTKQENYDSAVVAYLAALDHLETASPEVYQSIVQELRDQRTHLKLIASENFSSLAVQLAMGNLLTDKYAEGFPHHRFYAGCDNVDAVEDLAQNELKSLFGAAHAYVQPHSGADANLVAFWSILVQTCPKQRSGKAGKEKRRRVDPGGI